MRASPEQGDSGVRGEDVGVLGLPEFSNERVFLLDRRRPVERRRARRNSLKAAPRIVIVRGHFDEILGWNAADIHTGAAQRAALDDRHLASHSHGLDRGGDAGATRADDEHVIVGGVLGGLLHRLAGGLPLHGCFPQCRSEDLGRGRGPRRGGLACVRRQKRSLVSGALHRLNERIHLDRAGDVDVGGPCPVVHTRRRYSIHTLECVRDMARTVEAGHPLDLQFNGRRRQRNTVRVENTLWGMLLAIRVRRKWEGIVPMRPYCGRRDSASTTSMGIVCTFAELPPTIRSNVPGSTTHFIVGP